MLNKISQNVNHNVYIYEFGLNRTLNRRLCYCSPMKLFYVNAEFDLPRWMDPCRQYGTQGIIVCCELEKAHEMRPFLFDSNVTDKSYITKLRDELMPQIERFREDPPTLKCSNMIFYNVHIKYNCALSHDGKRLVD